MPHQCVRCGTLYEDGAQEILKGCSCGARLFFYIKKEKLQQAKKLDEQLDQKQKKQIEQDVKELIGDNYKDEPVVLDFESVRVRRPGKYEIDLVKIFKNDPLVFKLEEGKYIIDIASSFAKFKKR